MMFFAGLVAGRATASSADRIIVYKAKRTMLLMRQGRELRSYRIALGRTPVGPKQQQGDGKTPEGTYQISGRNPGSSFHKSLRISYPNAADRARARREGVDPGGDIMIHGLPNGRGALGTAHLLSDWTEGCIAVTNEEIEEIWRIVPNGIPVEIHP
jgi:murein L,D-transpeptidase YafK